MGIWVSPAELSLSAGDEILNSNLKLLLNDQYVGDTPYRTQSFSNFFRILEQISDVFRILEHISDFSEMSIFSDKFRNIGHFSDIRRTPKPILGTYLIKNAVVSPSNVTYNSPSAELPILSFSKLVFRL